jgi:hypothetical protein
VDVKPLGPGIAAPLTIVPTYPDLPMEEVFPPPLKQRNAGVYLRDTGHGRVVYLPGDIDRTFWEVLDVDHAKLLRNAVVWATNEEPPVAVEGRGVIDLAVWEQKDSMTVHLVNLTNPMMMKGPVREIFPIGRQLVRIRIPASRRVAKAKLLVANKEVPHRREGEFVLVEVPSIGVHEVVALDFV